MLTDSSRAPSPVMMMAPIGDERIAFVLDACLR
jgi:hypothetical protein